MANKHDDVSDCAVDGGCGGAVGRQLGPGAQLSGHESLHQGRGQDNRRSKSTESKSLYRCL